MLGSEGEWEHVVHLLVTGAAGGGMTCAQLIGLLKGTAKTGTETKSRFQARLTRKQIEPLYTERTISLPRLGIWCHLRPYQLCYSTGPVNTSN